MKSLGRYFEIRVSRHSYLGITALPTRKKKMFEPANVTNFLTETLHGTKILQHFTKRDGYDTEGLFNVMVLTIY